MSKEKAIIHINNVSKMLGTKRIKKVKVWPSIYKMSYA